MLTSNLFKENESTELCVLKKYATPEKAKRIWDRSCTHLYSHIPKFMAYDTIVFKYVEGDPLITCWDWDLHKAYLDRYLEVVDPCDFDASAFYCKGTRSVSRKLLSFIPSMGNRNWHGDMCQENIIYNHTNDTYTDIDLREDPVGDVYYDLGKFYRSYLYNTIGNEPRLIYKYGAPRMLEWAKQNFLSPSAIKIAAGIGLIRGGLLHDNNVMLKMGEELCKV